jgi:hypothetical protein
MPNTPRLVDVNWPAAFRPPMAPRDAPATAVVELTVERNVASPAPPAVAAVFVIGGTALLAVEVRPPTVPRLLAIPEPAAPVPALPIVSMSASVAEAAPCAYAIA